MFGFKKDRQSVVEEPLTDNNYDYMKDTPAERGWVYEFIESNGKIKNNVLVISDNSRKLDAICSIIMLTNKPNLYSVKMERNGELFYINSGMVTFAKRARLGKPLYKLDDETMDKVDSAVCTNLGFGEMAKYKIMYETLSNNLRV